MVSCVAIVLDERTIRLDEEVKAKAETRGLKVEIRNGGVLVVRGARWLELVGASREGAGNVLREGEAGGMV